MLGIRLDPRTATALESLARRSRRSKSEIAREAIARHVQEQDEDFLAEARRQSMLVATSEDAQDWAFMEAIEAEDSGWK